MPFCLTSIKRPVSALRFTYCCVLGLNVWERERTAPFLWLSPDGGFVAMMASFFLPTTSSGIFNFFLHCLNNTKGFHLIVYRTVLQKFHSFFILVSKSPKEPLHHQTTLEPFINKTVSLFVSIKKSFSTSGKAIFMKNL